MMSKTSLDHLSEATGFYWGASSVKILETPSPIEFMREAVSAYSPVIIRGIASSWPALDWTMDNLRIKIQDRNVNVNFTVSGDADSVKTIFDDNINNGDAKKNGDSHHFVYPYEQTQQFDILCDMLINRDPKDAVPYLSQQNDNFRREFNELMNDVPSSIDLATHCFDLNDPEAINIWIGDERSVSSIHKDYFENFYAVIDGEKTFTLLPPTDIAFLPQQSYTTARYDIKSDRRNDISACSRILKDDLVLVVNENERVCWIPLDPDDPHVLEKYPDFAKAHPVRCNVKKGEILYIPAMWYHRVSQNCLAIAINYWYDQRFDFRL